jgi:ubiquinone/menaquinone biosynthesis C-methylase UbiE
MTTSVTEPRRGEFDYGPDYAAEQAGRYLRMLRGEGPWVVRTRSVLDLVGPLRGRRVLDIGCGVGTFAMELAKQGNDCVGLDASPNMLRTASDLARSQRLTRCHFVVGDAALHPLRPATFDVVIASDIVEHLLPEPLARMIGACWEALKPGGVLLVHTFPAKYDYFFASWKWWGFVLPVWWLPPRALLRYVDWLDRRVVPRLRHAHRWVTERREEPLAHCNCLMRANLEEFVQRAGFAIRHSRAETTYPPSASRRFIDGLFGGREITKRNVFLVAVKAAADVAPEASARG